MKLTTPASFRAIIDATSHLPMAERAAVLREVYTHLAKVRPEIDDAAVVTVLTVGLRAIDAYMEASETGALVRAPGGSKDAS